MKKNIGFIFADDMEFKPFSEYALSHGGEYIKTNPQNVIHLLTEQTDIYAIESGVGKVNSAIAAMELIKTYNVSCILSAGLSGAISGLKRGDIVAGETYVECDFDIRAFGYRLGEKPGNKYIYKAPEEFVNTAINIEGVSSGKLGTGDFFLTDTQKKLEYKNEFEINAFDMESAAIAATCDKYSIPFMSIRKISDDADDTATELYHEMNNLAESDLTKILMRIIDTLPL